jgi:hypothetical protein
MAAPVLLNASAGQNAADRMSQCVGLNVAGPERAWTLAKMPQAFRAVRMSNHVTRESVRQQLCLLDLTALPIAFFGSLAAADSYAT